MDFQSIPDGYQPALVLAMLVLMTAAFVSDRYRPETIALAMPVALVLTGVLDIAEALQALSQPAPFAVACMFVLSAALERTGCINWLGNAILRVAADSPLRAFVALVLTAALGSSIINNTAVVIVLIPVVFRLAASVKLVPSKLLIPLSYAAIFGGTCTLLGTSTNLITDGLARESGLAPFGIFEIAPLGLILAGSGLCYLLLTYRYLPERRHVASALNDLPARLFVTELVVPAYSQLIGKNLAEAGLADLKGSKVIDVVRFDVSKRRELDKLQLQRGDRLLVRGEVSGLMALRQQTGLEATEANLHETTAQPTNLVEGIVGPRSHFIGHRLAEFNLRRRFNIHVVAIHRQGQTVNVTTDSVRFRIGDCLLLEGPQEGVHKLFETGDVVALTATRERLFLAKKAPIAIFTVATVILVAALGVLRIEGAAFLGALLVFLGGCLAGRDVAGTIEWRVLIIVYSMLILGSAVRSSGTEIVLVNALTSITEDANPYVALAVVYGFTVLVTEVITNNAAAILLTPIAIGVAQSIGVDPRPFVVAVMFAASTSFASPIGYQTNTLVYTSGGYRYVDFLRIGVPLALLYWAVASVVIPRIWPFYPTLN